MIDIVQWRSSIGVFNGCRGPSTTISHGSSTHHTTNSETTYVTTKYNPVIFTILYCIIDCVLHIPSLPIITIVSLLLILAGDVETNPGPVTGLLWMIASLVIMIFLIVGELVDALKDLVNWERFAVYLYIPHCDIQKIFRDYKTTDTQKFHLYQLWLTRCPNALWNDVVEALRKMNEQRMAHQIYEEKIIQVGELVDGLNELVNWEEFAVRLPMISWSDIEKITRDYRGSTDTQKFHLYQLWLNRYPNASWNDVVQVLHETGYIAMAEKIIQEKNIQVGESGLENEAIALALAEGKGKLFQTNILLHGPPCVGKSSLKKLILGLDPPTTEEQNSTDIMEKGVRAVSIDRVKEFQIIENEQLISMLAGEVGNHQHKLQSKESALTKPVGTFENKVLDSNDGDNFFPNITHSTKTDSILSIKENLDQATVPINIYGSKWHHVIDTGGQPQFLDILPLVYRTPPSLNIVVIRLTDGLDDNQKVCFNEKGKNVYTLPDRLTLTNRKFITNVCQIASIHHDSHSALQGSVTIKPRVMIVGTHMDKLGNAVVEKVKTFNVGLSKIQKEFSDVLICKDGEDNIIFPVNTMADGTERQMYKKEMQDYITKLTSNKVPAINVPLRWLVYELEIDKDEGVMSVRDCEQKGEPLGMKPVDVKNALTFLNKSALLLYYPDIDLVLTKMDPLVGRLSTLIKASFILPECDASAKMNRLRTSGLFDRSYLNDILNNDFITDKLEIDEFLKLLEHLKIIVNVDNDEYFIPSALSLEPVNESSAMSSTDDRKVVSFVFSLGVNRFLPHGFFFTVTIELLSCNDREYKFQLCGGTGSLVKQSRSKMYVQEVDGKIPGVITLTNRIKWIKVTSNTVDPQVYCPIIYKEVNAAIEKTLSRFKLPTTPQPLAAICPLCPIQKDDEHYCQLTPDGKSITCTRSGNSGRVTKEISYWFGGVHCATTSSSVRNKRSYPYSHAEILQQCIGDLMRAVGDPDMLAIDMYGSKLIVHGLMDEVITTRGLSRTEKFCKLLLDFQNSLRVKSIETKPLMIKFCDVLKKQRTDTLDSIILKIEEEL